MTAKTITRTVAEETFGLLKRQGLKMKVLTVTAKEKICPLEENRVQSGCVSLCKRPL